MLWWAAMAWAGSGAEVVDRLEELGLQPDLVLDCAPLGAVLERGHSLQGRTDLGGLKPPPVLWSQVATTELRAAAGLVEAGRVRVALSDNGALFETSFEGDTTRAERALAFLGGGHPGEVQWANDRMVDVDGSPSPEGTDVAFADGTLWLSQVKKRLPESGPVGTLLRQLDLADDGCLVVARQLPKPFAVSGAAGAMYLPLDPALPLRFRMWMRERVGVPTPVAAVGGTTEQSPQQVWALGLPLHPDWVDPRVIDAEVAELMRVADLDVAAGTTWARMEGGAMVVNATATTKGRSSPRRLLKALRDGFEALGYTVEGRGPLELQRPQLEARNVIGREEPRLFVATARGRVVLGTEAGLVEQVATERGDAWVTDVAADVSARSEITTLSKTPRGVVVVGVGPGGPVRTLEVRLATGESLTARDLPGL